MRAGLARRARRRAPVRPRSARSSPPRRSSSSLADVALPALGVRQHEPRQGAAGDHAHEDQPPVEVGAHAATGLGGRVAHAARIAESGPSRPRPGYTPPMPTVLVPFLLPVIALISVTPGPVAIHLGPIPILWYGLCYAIGPAPPTSSSPARRGAGASTQRLVDNGIIIVAAAALDRRPAVPRHRPVGTVPGQPGQDHPAALQRPRRLRRDHRRDDHRLLPHPPLELSFLRWADVIAPGLFVMQAIGRWGNFFNQELYGPPTNLPWGITIDCAHRVGDHGIPQYPCDLYPAATTGFHPVVPVRVDQRRARRDHLALDRPKVWPSDAARGSPAGLLRLVRSGPLRARDLADRQLDVLRHPDRDAHLGDCGGNLARALAYRHGPWAKDADRWGEPPQQIDAGTSSTRR